VEDLDNQIALLHARVAALDRDKAALTLAQIDFNRAKQLLGTPAESRQQYGRAQKTLSTAEAQVNENLAEVYQARATLGLPAHGSRSAAQPVRRRLCPASAIVDGARRIIDDHDFAGYAICPLRNRRNNATALYNTPTT
jgi:multidrug resistance efflux pump